MSKLRLPILVILGATGSGKSRLGIELGRRFGGEIISADSMQVYKSLDIITAKVTPEEQAMVPHHMLDLMDPLNEFTVVDFRNRALPIMNDLVKNQKIPIIVGGTNYYIESLIWQILIDNPKQSSDEADAEDGMPCLKVRRVEGLSNEELHKKLTEVDPEMAVRLHPNNRRKVIRSLEIFEQHGVTHSELLRQQRLAGGTGLGGPLRHENTLILWLTCNKVVLDKRLDSRVDSMLEAGLVQELLDFHERYNKDRIKKNELPDYTRGIFQSIGFKEFHNYLVLSKEKRESERGVNMLKEAIDNLKLATRRYSRRQQKWIRNRLMRRNDRQVPPLYTLDCTDVGQWESEVYGKAVDIVSAVLRGEEPSQRAANSRIEDAKLTDSSNESSRYCEDCERIFIGDLQWSAHLEGAKHRKVMEKKKKREEEEAKKMEDGLLVGENEVEREEKA